SLALSLLFHYSPSPLALHSFPTRRSSDLAGPFWRRIAPSPQRWRFFPWTSSRWVRASPPNCAASRWPTSRRMTPPARRRAPPSRSEEHTSELQSRFDLVCRLLLEKKKQKT